MNDGSTDLTLKVISGFEDPRFKVYSFSKNKGRPYARQKGLELAQGEYLAMLDADDFYAPDKLEEQIEVFLKHPNLASVTFAMGILDHDYNLVGKRLAKIPFNTVFEFDAKRNEPPPHASTMLRMPVAKNYCYDLSHSLGEDSDFLCRVLDGQKIIFYEEICYYYTELESRSYEKIKKSLNLKLKTNSKLNLPFATFVKSLIANRAKLLVYYFLFKLNLLGYYYMRRNAPVSSEELSKYFSLKKELI